MRDILNTHRLVLRNVIDERLRKDIPWFWQLHKAGYILDEIGDALESGALTRDVRIVVRDLDRTVGEQAVLLSAVLIEREKRKRNHRGHGRHDVPVIYDARVKQPPKILAEIHITHAGRTERV